MKKTTAKKRRRVNIDGDVHDTIEQKVSGEVVSKVEGTEQIEDEEAVVISDDEAIAEVGAEFSRTINTGDFTSVRISSFVRVCCKNTPEAIKKRAQWCEDFVVRRVSLNAEPYIQ